MKKYDYGRLTKNPLGKWCFFKNGSAKTTKSSRCYEYMNFDAVLSDLGARGWKLVTSRTCSDNSTEYLFIKRHAAKEKRETGRLRMGIYPG